MTTYYLHTERGKVEIPRSTAEKTNRKVTAVIA